MPFVEIGDIHKEWGRVSEEAISLSKTLRDKYFFVDDNHGFEKRVRVHHDADNNLIGLQPDGIGYKFRKEKFTIRSISKMNFTRGRFEAYWNEELKMVVIDLNKPLTTT